ncbi:MAG: DNA cytosine methyltransferase [Roseofilum sp. Belize BBD 4]|nr:DNA cytosine methyltransferase [Roseofilum sp. Belize BBD 4]
MKTVDLFAGCGGMSLGFQNAGFNLVAGFDIWRKAIQTYQENFDHPIFEQDLADLDAYKIVRYFQPDMIIGGPPCQDFSSAGKRDESLGRANLTLSFAKPVKLAEYVAGCILNYMVSVSPPIRDGALGDRQNPYIIPH